jgi:hypothetical protein
MICWPFGNLFFQRVAIMADDTIFRQLAFDFGPAIRDGPTPGEILGIPEAFFAPGQTLYKLLGPLGSFVRSIFERIEIAEGVIDEKKTARPLQADRIDRSFSLLCGTEVLEEAPHRLYRKHCEELIDRVVAGADTRPPTKAELIAAISGITFITPVKRHVTCLYWRIFTELFPADAQRIEDGDLSDTMIFSSYEQREADELMLGLSRRLTTADRILRP